MTETWRILNLEQQLGEPDTVVGERAIRAAGLAPEEVLGVRIGRRSVDARRRGASRRVRFVVHVDVDIAHGTRSSGLRRAERSGRAHLLAPPGRFEIDGAPHASLERRRVVVVGAGPAGLFAALTLARSGIAVDLVERGRPLDERGRSIAAFQRTRIVDPESNLLFGEGGAGTYSDGKLYTRVDHPLEGPILAELIRCGAPEDIAFDARAHIGTDRLHRILPALRLRLEELGVVFHWRTKFEELVASGDSPRTVRAVRTDRGELPCAAVLLALGHSARDSLRRLAQDGVVTEAKPFQLGVRIEHPQELITRARFGTGEDVNLLGPAYYNLSCRGGDQLPPVHSFCMCPGGQIVASVNSAGELCTNGMSNSRHSSPWANAALVVTVRPAELGAGAFAGMDLQAELEQRFFAAGGGDYRAPAQRADDFLAGRETSDPVASSYKPGLVPGRLDALLPESVRDGLRRGLAAFDRKIPGFAGPAGLLVGIESRSSGPVCQRRDPETRRATGFANLYPVGEGAGYAGGIMSAAIDGARSAQALLQLGVESS